MIQEIKTLIKQHEDLRLWLYHDTKGYLTIGWGRCLELNGIRMNEAELMLDNDIMQALSDLNSVFKDFEAFSERRKIAFGDMMFNLGKPHFLQFHKMIEAVKQRNWSIASAEMVDSKWARQVGVRALELAEMVREG